MEGALGMITEISLERYDDFSSPPSSPRIVAALLAFGDSGARSAPRHLESGAEAGQDHQNVTLHRLLDLDEGWRRQRLRAEGQLALARR